MHVQVLCTDISHSEDQRLQDTTEARKPEGRRKVDGFIIKISAAGAQQHIRINITAIITICRSS